MKKPSGPQLTASLLSIAITGLLSGLAVAAPQASPGATGQPTHEIRQVRDGKGGVVWQDARSIKSTNVPQGRTGSDLIGIQSITTDPQGKLQVKLGKFQGALRPAAQGDVFVSNPKLDDHVIFQAFALYQPNDHATYTSLASHAKELASWGVTDVWSPPPYRAASDSKYGEGYAIADRYDLGAYGKGPTKYGTADELKSALNALHGAGVRAQVDVVPNQMIGLNVRHVLPVTGVDMYGHPNNPFIDHFLYSTFAAGTAPGEQEHGYIKYWENYHFNGTSPQYQGLFRVLTDADNVPWRYLGPNNPGNHLPDWLAASDAAKYGKINTVDGYLLADSWFAVENAQNADALYAPLFLYYVEPRPHVVNQTFLDFARGLGYTGSDEEVRNTILGQLRTTPKVVSELSDEYLAEQPGYSQTSENDTGVAAFRYDGPGNDNSQIGTNVLDFEFLIGNDLDTTRADVQQEQLNWQKYLLDFGFDGFRIDAASHINTQVLRNESAQRLDYFAGDDHDNHLSYIESYVTAQVGFEQSNKFGQMVMDAGPYSGLLFSFGRGWAPLRYAFEASLIDRVHGGQPMPNWSFVNNHDQEHNLLGSIPLSQDEAAGSTPGSLAYELHQFDKYDADRNSVNKQWAPYNVPASYAILLTTKDTVPTVFYGDMFVSTKPYMSTPTPYHDDIVKLLTMRKRFAKGDQVIVYENSNTGSNGDDLVANVRLGTDRGTGVAVVAGDNPALDTTVRINMGGKHRNQWFVDALGFHPEHLRTDKDGVLTVHVQGSQTVDVKGYLATWVPDTFVLE